ncbi:hypothetical protein [Sphingomonas sp. 67-41]|uniref:hypothetical protein n=1 Tax=Sphingomonas TaxID=13687 RepID=UPI00257F4576|nr:hypothetical protein [Sphingomonas sp. 67-41]
MGGNIKFVLMDIWAPMARPALDLLIPQLRSAAMLLCDNVVRFCWDYRDYLLSDARSPRWFSVGDAAFRRRLRAYAVAAMSPSPGDPRIDSALPPLREGYEFISNGCAAIDPIFSKRG